MRPTSGLKEIAIKAEVSSRLGMKSKRGVDPGTILYPKSRCFLHIYINRTKSTDSIQFASIYSFN